MRMAHGKKMPIGLNSPRLIGVRCTRQPELLAVAGCVRGTPTAVWISRKRPSVSCVKAWSER